MLLIKQIIQSIKTVFAGYKTPQCVGVDIGSSAIKMVELANDSWIISKYSIKPITKNLVNEGVINDIEKTSDIILEQWSALNTINKQVSIAIPYNSVIIKELRAPKFKAKFELDDFVFKQLVQELDTDDIDFDYTIIDQDEDETKVSVVVAKKEKIEEYQAIIQMTGIDVAAIDIEPFAIQHLLHHLLSANKDNRQLLFIDIGVTRIRAYLFNDKQSVYFSEINVNYYSYIEDIITEFGGNISIREIDDIHGFLFNIIKDNTTKDFTDAIVGDVNKLIQLIKSNVLVERKINLADNYQIYLFGGNSLIPEVHTKISAIQNTKVLFADEFIIKNKKIPQSSLLRLFTSIALATWGQQIV